MGMKKHRKQIFTDPDETGNTERVCDSVYDESGKERLIFKTRHGYTMMSLDRFLEKVNGTPQP